jgi:hypothetical protein
LSCGGKHGDGNQGGGAGKHGNGDQGGKTASTTEMVATMRVRNSRGCCT